MTLLTLVVVNVALFSWLYAPMMLALEFTVIVFTLLAVIIIRTAFCDPPVSNSST